MLKLESLIGQENTSRILMGINILGFLGIVTFLQELQPNYVTLCCQYGFILILDSKRNPFVDETQYEALLMALVSGLNAIGFFTFFAALRRIDILVVMIVFDFKLLMRNSIVLQSKVSTILFLFGFILNLMSNDREIALWALVLGQVCHTCSELIQSQVNLPPTNLQLFKGVFLIMAALINFGYNSEKLENSFGTYLVTFILCIGLLLLDHLKSYITTKTATSESFIIGLQLFALLLSHKFKILATLSAVFYFFGIFALYIQKE